VPNHLCLPTLTVNLWVATDMGQKTNDLIARKQVYASMLGLSRLANICHPELVSGSLELG